MSGSPAPHPLSLLPAASVPTRVLMAAHTPLTCPDPGLRVIEAASFTCFVSVCFFVFVYFWAGDHWSKLCVHPEFPLERCSPFSAAKCHTVAFAWGIDWFALNWLHPVSLRPRRLLQQMRVQVMGRWMLGTWSSSAQKGSNQSLFTVIVLFTV